MQTTASSRKLTFACAALASWLGATVSHAQLTVQLIADATHVASGGDGQEATGWNDIGSANADLTGTSGTAPTWNAGQVGSSGANGYLTFNKAQSDLMSVSGITGGNIFSATASAVFLVVRAAAGNDGSGMFGWREGTHFLNTAQNDPDAAGPLGLTLAFSHEEGFERPMPVNFENNWHVVTMVRNGNSAEIHVDGSLVGTAGTFSAGLPTGTAGLVSVGTTPGTAQHWSGDIAEIRVYNSAANISTIEAELTATYLTPVPEPSQYATVFSLACVAGALIYRHRRQRAVAS